MLLQGFVSAMPVTLKSLALRLAIRFGNRSNGAVGKPYAVTLALCTGMGLGKDICGFGVEG